MSDDAILAYLDGVDQPVVGAKEIADEFGYATTKGARKRLKQMRDQGLVDRVKIGRVAAWYLTDAGRDRVAES